MNFSPPRGSLLILVLLGLPCVSAQGPTGQPVIEKAQSDSSAASLPSDDAAKVAAAAGEQDGNAVEEPAGGDSPQVGISGIVPQAGASESDALPEGFREEFSRRIAVLRDLRSELEQALGDQRDTFIRYLNDEDRSKAAEESYYNQRRKVRELLDQTYLAALDVTRMGMEPEAATYVATMVQHRFGLDIYDEPTLEGAARLIDGGSKMTYLFQSAARSAVVEGRFDMAKKLLEAIDDDQMESVDETLEYLLDKYQESFEREKRIREQEAKEDRLPRVALRTTQGDVVLELFLDQAPSAVSNFIRLVEEGFYDGLDFYQVIDHLFALTGDPSGLGNGNSGKFLFDEHDREDARDAFRGSLVMAKVPLGETGKFVPNSASSQFAILFLPILSIPEQQTVFGRVIEGMEAISRLRRVDPNKAKGKGKIVLPPDRIIEATVIRRPDELPEPRYFDPASLMQTDPGP